MDKLETVDKYDLKERVRGLVSDAECQRYTQREIIARAEQLIDDAWDAGTDAAQEWTPVSEKPKATGWYQTTKRGPSGARYVRDEVFRVETGAWDGGSEVIAWRKLPPPYNPEVQQ